MVSRLLTTLCFDLKVEGLDNVPRKGGVLLVANHQSFLDPPLIGAQLHRRVSFFAKSELFDVPFFGWLIRHLHAFPVQKGKGDRAAVQQAIDRLKAGRALNIYPEGSRTQTGEIGTIQSGAALLVKRAGVPVVPIAIDGSFEAWPKGQKLFRRHPVRVKVGPPLDINGLDSREITQLIDKTLRTMLEELKSRNVPVDVATRIQTVGIDPESPVIERSLFWRGGQVICRLVCTLMFDLKVYGRRHMPARGGVLLVANHQSFLDPVLVSLPLYRPVSFFARASLFENPFFGRVIRCLHAFPVQRGKGDRAAVQQAIERLKEGYVLNFYPEGSRTEDGNIGPIQPGIGLIARRAGVPIVPVVVDGSFHAWPKDKKIFHPHPVKVMYGPPMHVEGLRSDEIVELVGNTLKQMLADLRARR